MIKLQKIEGENEMNKKKENKQVLGAVLLLLLLVVATVGVTYAFFSYSKLGTTENTITTGTLTFAYNESGAAGNAINITNMLPMSDTEGMELTGADNVFDFQITGKTAGGQILYDIVASKVAQPRELPENVVKIALTKVRGDVEENVTGTGTGITATATYPKYSELTAMTEEDFTEIPVNVNANERFLYREVIPNNAGAYAEQFRLRMWISEDAVSTDTSTGEWDYNDKAFTARVNVYAKDVQ